MSTVRIRRLQADYEKVKEYTRRHPRLELIQAEGTPPERYQIRYQMLGLRQKDDELVEVDSHLVEISLPRDYPRTPPQCRMLTPIFHPNIAPHAICIGDHWSAGEPLSSLIARIGEMITYQSYNTKSPLNGEAAKWTDKNLDLLPLEAIGMILDDLGGRGAGGSTAAIADSVRPARSVAPVDRPASPVAPSPRPQSSSAPSVGTSAPATYPCPQCGARLRTAPELIGKKVRCPRCQTISVVAPAS
jgi:ubiquitin-protein ligase